MPLNCERYNAVKWIYRLEHIVDKCNENEDVVTLSLIKFYATFYKIIDSTLAHLYDAMKNNPNRSDAHFQTKLKEKRKHYHEFVLNHNPIMFLDRLWDYSWWKMITSIVLKKIFSLSIRAQM